MRPHLPQLAPLIIAVLSMTLLIGARFEATWAGGDGQTGEPPAKLAALRRMGSEADEPRENETIYRGQSMKTVSGEWKRYIADRDGVQTMLYLDERTEIKFLPSESAVPSYQIIQGRAVVVGPATMSVRDVHIKTDGTVAYTFYSWLDQLDVASLRGSTSLHIGSNTVDIPSQSFQIQTLAPYTNPQAIIFDPASSNASAFYSWALGE